MKLQGFVTYPNSQASELIAQNPGKLPATKLSTAMVGALKEAQSLPD